MSSLLYLEVSLNLTDGSGIPAAYGTARFVPSATLTDVVDGEYITQSPVTVSFGPGGSPVVRLLQTDNVNVQPSGWAWQATLNVNGQPPAIEFLLPAGPATFTATNASPCVFTIPNSTGFGASAPPDGTGVTLAGGSLPAGFSSATTYYVVAASGLTFQLAATQGGGAIASTSTGSGSVTAVSYQLSAVTTVQSAALTAQFVPLPANTPVADYVVAVNTTNPLTTKFTAQTGGGGGAVASVFSRTGGVTAQSGDYSVGQVTGAAPSANPTFTGTVTVPTTVNATDPAQKQYVDAVASGLDTKPSVTALASGNITLSGTQTIDGVAVVAGNRVLCTGQSTASQNGIQVVASGAWSRPADFATGSTQDGAFVFVEAGTANASSGWTLVGASPVTVDTGSQSWTQFSGAGEVVAGTGLSKAGNTLSVATDSTTGDIQPSPGTAAAGGNGKPADAAHVHPQPPFLAPTASTGATAAVRYMAGTVSGPPQSGTWAVGDLVPDQQGAAWACVIAGTAPTAGQFRRQGDQPWQFRPESYLAKGDMAIAHDVAITSGQPALTTVGVANPTTAPTLATATTGGTVAAGTYQVEYTYVTASGGETLASSSASITTTGSTSTITVTTPASNGVPGGAIGWVAYITAVGGSTFFKQMVVTSPWPFPNNYILSAPPVTTTANPPGANTTTSSPWAGMVSGQAIRVIGAGAAGADLRTTILSVGGSSATLNANAGTTVSAVGAVWGTDDTAAVQSAINAAAAYFQASNRTGEVLLSKLYLSNTAPAVGGAYAGNCVLQLPSIPNGAAKVRVSVIGASKDVSTIPTYQQMVPEMSGTGVIYIGPNGTNDATYGPAHVFGTPTLPSIFVDESGSKPGTTNIKVMMDSVRVVVPFAAGLGGIDLFSAAESANYNCSVNALGIVPSGGSWTRILANGPTTNQWGWGLREPGPGNNAVSYTEQFTAHGLCYGYGPSEHLVSLDVFCMYCVTGIEGYSNNITMVHNAHIISAGVEFCTNAVGAADGTVRIDIDNLRTESIGGKIVFDGSNRLQGTIGLRDQGASGQYKTGYFTGGSGVRLVSLMTQPGPLASPQAAPATTVAWSNFYYRDAWITVAVAGGTFTSLSIDAVAQPNAAGVATYGFFLPSGHSYTPAYSAGTLTHTVTLI